MWTWVLLLEVLFVGALWGLWATRAQLCRRRDAWTMRPSGPPPTHVVLVGDSSLCNDAYVPSPGDQTVSAWVRRSVPRVTLLAADHARVCDADDQVRGEVRRAWNGPQTAVVVSVGGNDLLDGASSRQVAQRVQRCVRSVQSRVPLARVCVCDVYLPGDVALAQVRPRAQQYNAALRAWVHTQPRLVFIPLSETLTEPGDFTHGVEPSVEGGRKLAAAIVSALQTEH